VFEILAGGFVVMLLAVVFARLASLPGVRRDFVSVLGLPLARNGASAEWQRRQTHRNDDSPNQYFHNVISAPVTEEDAADAKKLQPL
jgi:hypothetical protein